MQEKTIWLSFDLGIRGDYPNLYKFFDEHHAEACGGTLAVMKYAFASDLVSELKADLSKRLTLKSTDQIYLIYRDDETARIKGLFLFGVRSKPAWEGYAAEPLRQTVDEE